MKIITSWDDGCKHDFKIVELLEKHELPGIFYWPCNLSRSANLGKVKEFLTLNDCIEISKKFDVGSHTMTHQYLTELTTIKQITNEIVESKAFWEKVLDKTITSFCYPRGRNNSMIRLLVKGAGYKNARTTIVGCTQPSIDPFKETTSVHVGVDRVEYKGKCWEDFARDMLQKAREEENSIFHIFGHSWEIEREKDWKALDNLFKEMKL